MTILPHQECVKLTAVIYLLPIKPWGEGRGAGRIHRDESGSNQCNVQGRHEGILGLE